MRLSIVIPVYNEESTIGEVIDRVSAVDIEKEIIVVDDGSTDRTREVIRGRADKVRHIHEGRANFGKGAAVRIGLTYARGDVVLVQDADLELDPNEYAALIDPIERGRTNVVFGSRFKRHNDIPRKTRIANILLASLTNLLYGSRLSDMETAYKAFRRNTIQSVRLESMRFEIEPEVTAKLLRLGEQIVEIPIAYRPRRPDEGKKIGWRDGIAALVALVRYRLADQRSLVARTPQLSDGDPAETH